MSVTISDIMKLPSLSGASIAAGLKGMNRTISAISVMESSDEEGLGIKFQGQSNYYGQEIIITAFMAARDDVNKQCAAIRRLQQEGEVGIIVFYVGSILPCLDQRVIDLADQLEIPMIVMPEKRLELRYGDVICEVMGAIVEDRHKNTYFVTEVIDRISHIHASQRSINSVFSIIRDRVQCSIYLFDELDRNLNSVEWPHGRELPITALLDELNQHDAAESQIEGITLQGKRYYLDRESIHNADTKLNLVIVKEKNNLTVDCCKQIKYILTTYINLWAENYGQLDTKQLVSAIINDEPEKMRRIGDILHLDVESLSCVYFFYSEDDDRDYEHLKQVKNLVKNYIFAYKNNFLVDIFDETIVVFADRTRERIDSDLFGLLQELEQKGFRYRVVSDVVANTTHSVKKSYWLYQQCRKYTPIIFPYKRVVTGAEIAFIHRVKTLFNQHSTVPIFAEELSNELFTEKRELELTNTLETFLLDGDMSITKTAELMFVHKNTIKYRIKCIEEILGYKISKMPVSYDLYIGAALNRINRSI